MSKVTSADDSHDKGHTHLTHADLISLMMQLNGRIDTLWQRVIYAHAAIVGVMVFFATSEEAFVVPRLLVLFFYTMNTLITFAAFNKAVRCRLTVAICGSPLYWRPCLTHPFSNVRARATTSQAWLLCRKPVASLPIWPNGSMGRRKF